MRFRRLFHIALAASVLVPALAPAPLRAQDASTSSGGMADGLVPGDYLRIGGGISSPFRPAGSLRDWKRGSVVGASWENWQSGSGGMGIVGFGIGFDVSTLPFNEQQFAASFNPGSAGALQSASASSAHIWQFGLTTLFRIPAPFIMPHLSLGFGFMNWRPGEITYTTASGSTTVTQQRKSGASFSLGAGLDKHIYDRFAIFAQGNWVYGLTSYGAGLATPTGVCATTTCDVLKNTSLVTLRGGLRIRASR